MQNIKSFMACILALLPLLATGQPKHSDKIPFLQPADTLHQKRFLTSAITGAAIYSSFSVGLWKAWYQNEDLIHFHFFNDWREWERMDKLGHMFITYNESRWLYQGARWTGMSRRKAMWTGAAIAYGLQATIEVMDGFGEKWGFSLTDMAFNTLGTGLFVGQELLWEEQRITMKISSRTIDYPNVRVYSDDGNHNITLQERATELYGSSFGQRFLKDYNAQTLWLSFNVQSFLPDKASRFPDWLNIAIGYGAGNMFEGDDEAYGWIKKEPDGTSIHFIRDPLQFPRYQQLYFSLDIDLTRIKTRSRFLKTMFNVLNFIKIPAPALEFNSLGEVRFWPLL